MGRVRNKQGNKQLESNRGAVRLMRSAERASTREREYKA